MIFLVPDLEKYDAVRGGVIPYAPDRARPARDHDAGGRRRWSATSTASRGVPPAERETFRRDYADLDDGHASARLVDAVFTPRGDG